MFMAVRERVKFRREEGRRPQDTALGDTESEWEGLGTVRVKCDEQGATGTDEEGCVMVLMSESLMILWVKGHPQGKDAD